MLTVFSPRHATHAGQSELVAGAIVPAFEMPRRAEIIRARIAEVGLGPVREPGDWPLDVARKVHAPDYLDFLAGIHARWQAEGNEGTALPFVWPVPGLRRDVPPARVDGLLGFYTFDGGAPFVAGTWNAIKSSHDTALSAADLALEERSSVFALCRPPGHHAARALAGGYCYINNAAVAAQHLRDSGAARVAVLDVDYHHGNGTQAIFYDRPDVLVVNVHADPVVEYPYFLGHADERGEAEGEGFTLNLPLPHETEWPVWEAALGIGLERIADFAPDMLVISLGTDTFHADPISRFRLDTPHYPLIGARIRALGVPTVFVMEGGYAVEAIGVNAVGVLTGFEAA
jgi:acetoin utilization deacetylase AcuC-like enzyme